MNARRILTGLLVCVLAVMMLYVPPACAGEIDLTIEAQENGVDVYSSYTSKKSMGLLYNGYMLTGYPREKNGRNDFSLTSEYSVYIDLEKAREKLPEHYNPYGGKWYEDVYKSLPCNAFEAEVCVAETPLLLKPDGTKTAMTCYKGTRTIVWGEFGNKYFVDDYGLTGFIEKKHLSRIADISFWEANKAWHEDGYEDRFEEKTVYTDGGHIPVEKNYAHFLENGDKVRVRAYTDNGLAQLLDDSFVEARFLDPEADHTTNSVFATVKTESPLSRLRVEPVNDDYVQKLCSGVRVEVLDEDEDTALIYLTGSDKKSQILGNVKKKYLAFGDEAGKVKDGCTRVTLTEEYKNRNYVLPAGTVLTVIGCEEAMDAGDPDWIYVFTETGELRRIFNKDGTLDPIDPAGYKAKTTSKLAFREKPNKEGQQIKMLSKGTTVEVLLRGECWTMIRLNEKTGYVMSRYLKFLD